MSDEQCKNEFPLGCDLVPDDERNFGYHNIVEIGSNPVLPAIIEVLAYQFNQGSIDSCVGHAVGGAKSTQEKEQESPRFNWSASKREQGYAGWGTNVPLALKMLQKYGIPKLSTVPNDITLSRDEYMRVIDTLNDEVFKEAFERRSLSYWYIYASNQALVSQALVTEKIPLITTMMWYKGYNRTDKDGFLPKPVAGEEVGGHAFILIRKERIGDRVKCTFKNSWGEHWGDKGNFHVWEDEIVSVYKMGTFFVIVDIPKEEANILNKYNGKLIKNEDDVKVYFVWRKEITWIQDEPTFNLLAGQAWGNWADILTIPEPIKGTKKFVYKDFNS